MDRDVNKKDNGQIAHHPSWSSPKGWPPVCLFFEAINHQKSFSFGLLECWYGIRYTEFHRSNVRRRLRMSTRNREKTFFARSDKGWYYNYKTF